MKQIGKNKHVKRLLKHILGWFCIVVGLVMFVTPGQGLLTLLAGIFLLADEIPFFGKIRTWIGRKFPKTFKYVHDKGDQLKAMFQTKRATINE